jgi:hypothetical protein
MLLALRRSWIAATLLCGALAAGCGGQPAPAPAQSGPAEATFLAGIHASDIAKVMRIRGLACGEPRQDQGFSHWTCEVKTPLLAYTADYYGRVPGRLEYIRLVVSQTGAPKIEQITPVVMDIAGLRYAGVDRAAVKTWVEQHLTSGGVTTIGPVKFKLSGDVSRLVFEVKAPGSEW